MLSQIEEFRRFLEGLGIKESTVSRYVSAVRGALAAMHDPTDGSQLEAYRRRLTATTARLFNAAWERYAAFCADQEIQVAMNAVDRGRYRSLVEMLIYATPKIPPPVLKDAQWRHVVIDDHMSGISINGKWFELTPESRSITLDLRGLLRAGNHLNMHWSIVSKAPDRDAPLGISTIYRIRQQGSHVISSPSGPFHHDWEREVYATLIRCGFTSDNADAALESIRIYAPIELPKSAVQTPMGTYVADFTKGTISTVKVLPAPEDSNVIPIRAGVRVEPVEAEYEEVSLEQRLFASKPKDEAPSEVFDPVKFEKMMEEKRRAHEARRKAQQEAEAASQSQSSSMSAPVNSASSASSMDGGAGTSDSPGAATFTLPPTIRL